jgi:hypothetical protein
MVVEQKGIPEYDHCAKKSLVFGIIVIFSIPVFWLLIGLFTSFGTDIGIVNDLIFYTMFLAFPIVVAVLAILGIIFGIKGLKSTRTGMSITGLIISSIILLLLLVIVFVIAGSGNIM